MFKDITVTNDKFSCRLSANLSTEWASGDFYQKQMFQNMLFPRGLGYDAKNDTYRTTEVNLIFSLIAYLSKDWKKNKNGTSQNLIEKSRSVPRKRLELSRLAAYAPQAYLYTIPTPGHVILPDNSQNNNA